jgi:hypothetical protein
MAVTPQEGVVGSTTRTTLHRVAAHVLGRRRFEVSGRFGLRASPGGFATPAFGPEPELIRVAGVSVVREVGGERRSMRIAGATMRELENFAGVDLGAPYSCGADTPDPGDLDAPLEVDTGEARRLARWFATGWVAMDEVLESLAPEAEPATIQLWPEHFDAGTNVAVAGGERVNLGFSPGDAYEPEPYAYVGPWSPERRGDPGFWNAPFGAVLRAGDVGAGSEGLRRCVEFLRRGLENAAG